ncbi:hypothetical protein [Fortiea contorta]|uniref:hypothetical protein n=1 Tax=Fortiea contorta TaxID=1892405 RepID=UPI000346EF64|nr:hypothetical protein [Fortiea contorta]
MVENSENTKILDNTTAVELSHKELEAIPLLPRSGWVNQVSYLKLVLKTKQALDARKKPIS